MLKDITLGQYYPQESVIHKLDPRVKLFGTFLFIISLFINDNFIGYIASVLFLATVIILSKVPFSFMVRGMKAIVLLLLFSVVLNLFMTEGEVLVSFWKLTITKEGLYTAIFMAIRLSFLIIGSSIMTLTTTPN
ncbi:MAG: energy-coupling factor transporter transmembrane protein EcfT, partial [Lachnospiraceae bacterium]|nr:energy-coupling factor transporter transmembrane protein EcfT [Lachnospiraceae bacterium]